MHSHTICMRKRIIFLMSLSVVAGTMLAQPLHAQQSPDMASVNMQLTNKTCPVTTGEAVDPDQWVDYQGQRIYFCCGTCKRKFERNPQAYMDNLPKLATVTPATSPEANAHDDHDHEAAVANGHDSQEPSNEAVEHDHSAHQHADNQTGIAKLIAWLGKFHPPSVHFPIALLISAALAELLLIITKRTLFDAAAQFCVWGGSIGTFSAVTLGWFLAGFRLNDPDWIMTTHRWLGTAVGLSAVLILMLCIASHEGGTRQLQWRWWFRVMLFITAIAVAMNGFLGGALIYGLNHYAW